MRFADAAASGVLAVQTQLFSIGDKEVTMSETDEKLIVKLGQRIGEQN